MSDPASSPRRRRLADRLPPFEVLLVLLAAYFALATLYGWQAWQRDTPTIFTDEIEFTQISRSIAATGHATLRGGDPAGRVSLYAYLAAPFWWLGSVASSYAAIKYLGVLLMTATIFPAYGLARLAVSRRYAVFAAVAAGATPALSYSPFLVEEPLAYPVSTLALLSIAVAVARPRRLSLALAVGACMLGVAVRAQLAVLLVVLALGLLARGWSSKRMRSWRARWTAWDWAGAAALAVGVAVLLSAALGHRSQTWYVATGFFKVRMLEYGLWAAGALAIGLGVLPLIAGLAGLARRREPDERLRAFVVVAVAAIVVFGWYTAVKAAYLSTVFSIVVAERNLIYLVPLLFTGTALVLERRVVPLWATAAATALAAYLVATTPYTLSQYPNYEAHGLAVTAFGNRILRWPADQIETALLVIVVLCGIAVVTLRFARGRGLTVAVAALGAFVLAWNVTAEIYAANGERLFSERMYATLPKPPNWVDRVTDGKPALFLGQGISDQNPVWQLEFWNRSLHLFWGIDGSVPGPGKRTTPNLARPDGTLDPEDIDADYAVVANGVSLNADRLTRVGNLDLYRLDGPVRLRETLAGVSDDGWMSTFASYTRYDVAGDGRGFAKVTLSRVAWCGDKDIPGNATIRIGPVEVDKNDQAGIARVTQTEHVVIRACESATVLLRAPQEPWRVEVTVDKTFVPHELDPGAPDKRELSAKPSFEFIKLG